jgi:hypothetical protein
MNLKPAPTIFGVDLRGGYSRKCTFRDWSANANRLLADANVLVPLLFRLTDTSELPILLIGGKPVGSMDTIRELRTNGQLKALVTHAGAVLDDPKKRRKGRR